MLLTRFDAPFPPPELAVIDDRSLREARNHVDWLIDDVLDPAESLEDREVSWARSLMIFAARLGRLRLEAGSGVPLGGLSTNRRTQLARELEPLIAKHRSLWLERSRPGGLDRSARWLERILEALRAG